MKYLLLCVVALLFLGCATKNYDYLTTNKSLSQSKKLSLVIYPQEEYFCGPSSIATLLAHQHITFVYADVIGSTFTPELKGALQVEMKATARHYGLIPYMVSPDLASILAEVSSDRPVLVLLNLGLESLPTWHYSVVTGFDMGAKHVYLLDAKNADAKMPFDAFETFFERAGSWAIVALKPPLLPVASSEIETVNAIVDMAQVGHQNKAKDAAMAYVKQRPMSFLASMMLANIHFGMKEYLNATTQYKRALGLKPNDPVVLNNLARSLMRENKLHEAKPHALAAVNAGGVFLQTSQATLEQINQQLHQ